MRILFVNEKCGYFGGAEQNVAATAQGLRANGHRCFLAYGTGTERDFDHYRSLFDGVFQCRDIQGPLEKVGHPFEDVIAKVSPDVIYVHKVPKVDFCLSFLHKIHTVRMIHDHDVCCPRRHKYYVHNGRVCTNEAGWRCYLDLAFLEKGPQGRRIPGYVSIGRKLAEMRRNYDFDKLLVGSRFMRQELLQNGFPVSKVRILPPMVPIEPVGATPVPGEPTILCVAQLIRGKGVDLLLKSLKKVACDFRATIVGTGNAEGKLAELCHRLQLDDRVRFKGWVNNNEIGSFYSAARVVAVPSRWPEPFGMIGLEAMHHGRPVVAFNVGGIPDWLESDVTGLIAPEQDVDALADALGRILKDRELARELGEKGLSRVRERFSFEDYLHQTLELLRN